MQPKLSKEQAAKLLNANLGNVVEKLKSKKTLTKSELALIQAAASEEPLEDARAFVETKIDLAKVLGISRMQLDRYLKLRRNGPPKARSDGRWPVLEWKRWMRETGRAGGVGGDDLEDELPRLNAKRLLLINERLELDNAERKGALIDRAEVVKELAEMATTLRTSLYGEAASLCEQVMKLTAIDEAVKVYNDAIDRVLADLVAGLKAARPRRRAVADLGVDEEDDE